MFVWQNIETGRNVVIVWQNNEAKRDVVFVLAK